VGAHAKSVRDGFEILFLFVNAVTAAPPPSLVDEGSVSGIHEANDAVVDADRHFRLEIRQLIFFAEFFNLRGGVGRLGGRGESCAGRGRIGDVDPEEPVLLLAGVAAGVDAVDFESLIGGERRDQLALAVVDVELPAVVSALEIFSVKSAAVQRHTAMGAGVAQSERLALGVAAQDQRDFEERGLVKLIAMDTVGRQGAIPESGEHLRVGGLALRRVEVGHGEIAYASIRWIGAAAISGCGSGKLPSAA